MPEPRGGEQVGRGAAGSRIGEDEVVVTVGEEELAIRKRPVVKEVLKIRKVVAEEVQVAEADLRKEELEI